MKRFILAAAMSAAVVGSPQTVAAACDATTKNYIQICINQCVGGGKQASTCSNECRALYQCAKPSAPERFDITENLLGLEAPTGQLSVSHDFPKL